MDSGRGDKSAQTESSPEGMVVRSGTETSTAASFATFLLIDAFWVIFSALDSLSLSHCVFESLLCFGIVGLCIRKVLFLTKKTQVFCLK